MLVTAQSHNWYPRNTTQTKIVVCGDVTSCSLWKTCTNVSEGRDASIITVDYWCLVHSGSRSVRNVGKHLPEYTELDKNLATFIDTTLRTLNLSLSLYIYIYMCVCVCVCVCVCARLFRSKVSPVCVTKAYRKKRNKAPFHPFLTTVLEGGKWTKHVPVALSPGKDADTDWTGGWVAARVGLDALEKRKNVLNPTGIRTPDHTGHNST
jgi:hypothetical protein